MHAAAASGAVGAAMGTVVPVVGTIIGAILGIVVGGLIGLSQATSSITEENVDRAIHQIDKSNLKLTDDFIEKVKKWCRANSENFTEQELKFIEDYEAVEGDNGLANFLSETQVTADQLNDLVSFK